MAKIQKGWLKTREGEYFSPITLAENIYSRDGKKYDDIIKGYIDDVNGDQSELGQRIDDLYERLKNFNGSDADTFYIVDNQGNIIFKIDAQGAHSTNFISLDGNLNQVIADLAKETANRNQQYLLLTNKDIELANLVNSNKTEIDDIQTKIRNFKNEEDDEVLYITDATGNIIAKIDNEGVQSINFKSLDGDLNETISKLNEEIQLRNNQFIDLFNKDIELNGKINLNTNNIEDIYNKIKNIKDDESDVFYFTDMEGNIIAKVDNSGVQSINFTSLDGNLNETISKLNEEIELRNNQFISLSNKDIEVIEKINLNVTNIEDIYNKIRNFKNEEDDDTFYITDSEGNVIFKVLDGGVYTTNLNTLKYDVNATLDRLFIDLNKEIDDRKTSIQAVESSISASNSKLNTLIGEDPNKSTRTIANEELAAQLLSGKADADFKTLQQLATWLEGHPEDVAAINLAISILQKQLDGFEEVEGSVLSHVNNLDSSLQSIINDRLKNFDGNDDDILYITDNDGNIIAQFDQNGLFVKDVKLQNGKTLQKNSLFYSIENYKEINI